jgi:hypothetical protein
VKDPVHAIKEGGLSSLPRGVVSGVAGLITKPTAGALGMISKTAEGLHAAGSSSVDPNRMRYPRYIGHDKVNLSNLKFDIYYVVGHYCV